MNPMLYPLNNSFNDMQIEQSKELVIEKTIPTTEAQKEIWLACEIGGQQANLSYNQSFTIDFTGNLQTDKLCEALKQLVIRHEALRSNFSINGQKSNIYVQPPIRVEKRDLSHLPALLQEEQFGEFIREDALQSFNLQNDVLFRFTLHIFNDQKHRLTLSLHHIVADGWSINIILKDLSKIYSELVQNKEIKLPPASQISEYVTDEIDYKKSHAFQQTEEFWTSRFKKQPASLNLPTDFPRKPERVYQSSRADFPIDQDQIEKIKQFSIKHQCSLPTILISTFKIFLYQISFQKNIILGLPTSGQVSQEKYNLVGHCANLLPLISELDPLKPFITHLKETRSNLFDAYEHQNFTFGELFKKILINRDHSRAVLVPVVLNIDTSLGDQVSFLGLNHKIISNPKSHEVFEIFLNINHTKAETVFEWTYNKELFKEESIRKYHESFVNILEKAIHNPECSIAEIVHKKQDNLVSKSIDKTLNELFYSAVEQFEQLPAVRFKNVQLTYNELNKFSNQFARYLLKKGIAPGDMVGISCSRSVDTVIALLGIIKARACYVPIDMSLPLERINYIVQNANIKLLFDEKWLNKHIVASNEFDANNLTLESDSHDLIYLLHTSGSTGVPKGVCMGDQALVNLLLWQINNSAMKAHSKTLQYSALSFDVSFQEIFATLLSGGELILIDEETRKDPKELLGYINQHGVNRLFMPFVALQSIADTAVNSCLFPSSLKEVITAGEQLKVTKQIRQLFSSLKHCTLSNQYGPTECHVVSQLKLEGSPETWPHLPSIGKEIYNTQIFILDNNLQEVLPGETGELCISGLPLAQGYLNQPEITSDKFITFVSDDGEHICIYKTGDLAKRLPNGEIDFLGRQDFQVKIRGYRVELGEIEHHILAQKNIRDAVVTCRESLLGNQQLTAYYILRDRHAENIDIRQAIQQRLPEYMIPHHFIEVDQFPKTTSGKIDRKRLPSPQINSPKIKSDEDQPLDIVQEKVVNVWKHFLSNENVTVDSNFFEMGGHSLIAINVLIELEKQTGIRPKLSSIFKFPRLKDFALLYEKTLPKSDFEINQNNQQIISDETAAIIEAPILETQLEIWVTSILGGDLANKSYNISSAHILTGDLNIECLEKTIEAIVNRHESLRTRFNEDGSKMLIHKTVPVHIHQDDYSALDKFEQNQKILTYSREVSEAPFDLREENLFRFSLLKLSSNSYYFIFTVHHLICDGYSINVLLREISIIYNQLSKNKVQDLLPALSLLNYALQKNKFYASSRYEEIKQYWVGQLLTDQKPLNLPYDFDRTEQKNYSGASIITRLPSTLVNKINLYSSQKQSSFTITLKILFELSLYRITKQSNFTIGNLYSDQLYSGHDNLVGNCVNLLPVYCRINADKTFDQHFDSRKNELIENISNQAITFGSLINDLKLKQNLSLSDYISVVFNPMLGIENSLNLNNLGTEPYIFDSGTEKFDLTVNVYGTEDKPLIEWNYRTQIFKKETIDTFIQDFELTINQLLSSPQVQIHDILDNNINFKRKNTNNSDTSYYKYNSILDAFHETVIIRRNKPAVEYINESFTYWDLDLKSNQLAHYFKFKGVNKGDVIAMVVDRNLELVLIMLAILKCGAAYVPLDPNYPAERLHFMLDDSDCQFSIISKNVNLKSNKVNLFEDFDWQKLSSFPSSQIDLKIEGADLAYILYTSGSTGNPKGVQITHKSLLNCLTSFQQQPGIEIDDRFLAITTISFDIAAVELFLPIITGATMILAGSHIAKDSRELHKLLKSKNITILQATPTTWKMLVQSDWKLPIKSLCGGEPLSKDLAKDILGRTDELWNVYGPTETTIWSSIKKISIDDRTITVGLPINNTQIYVLDEKLNEVPTGSTGEIYIGGDGVAVGYLNRPELNNEKFIDDPFLAGSSIYATGDLGYKDSNGELVCLGRKDLQVKVRGHRIELEEIEYFLRKKSDIEDVVVVCNTLVSEEPTLIAYIISKPNTLKANDTYVFASEADVKRWREHLKKHLPPYMIPNFYIKVPDYPKTENGKVNRLKLPQLNLENLVLSKSSSRSENETRLSKIWSESLKVKQVNVNDNFFDLGGTSLTAVRLMLKIENEFKVKLPINILYNRPTVSELVKEIQQHESTKKLDLIVPIKSTGSKKPLYMIHGLGLNVLGFEPLRKYIDADQPIYGLQAVGLKGDIDSVPKTLEKMATIYAQEIINHTQNGPYNIAGYSSGGALAYEVARQIVNMGKSVSKLVIIDTQVCGSSKAENESIFSRRRYRKVIFIASSFLRYPVQASKHHFKKLASKLKLIDYNEAYPDAPVDIENKKLLTHHYLLFTRYTPTAVNIEINLIKSKERVYFLNDMKTYGWQAYTTKKVHVWSTSGNHFTCFNYPHVKDLSARLQQILDS